MSSNILPERAFSSATTFRMDHPNSIFVHNFKSLTNLGVRLILILDATESLCELTHGHSINTLSIQYRRHTFL